jgi:hypothetical protein
MNFFEDLAERFYELHVDIAKAIGGLPTKALDWVPGPEMNSISVLVVHLIGAERYWIGDVAHGDDSNRVREQEFLVSGLTVDDLEHRLFAADEYIRLSMSHFSLSDLDKICKSPRNEKTFTVGWSLLHALEHTALHTGHIQLTRQLWYMKE